jgi:hypothetical protein
VRVREQGLELEPALGLGLEPALGLGPGLGLEPVPGLVQGQVRHTQQPPIRLALPLPSPKLIFVFYSFSPPKILGPSHVKIFSVESYHLLYRILGYSS